MFSLLIVLHSVLLKKIQSAESETAGLLLSILLAGSARLFHKKPGLLEDVSTVQGAIVPDHEYSLSIANQHGLKGFLRD